MFESRSERVFGDAPLRCYLATSVVGLAKQLLHECVDHHVSRAGIEGEQRVGSGGGRDHSQVANASDILQDSRALFVGELDVVEQRHQRSALSACDHVGGTEIADYGDAQLCGEKGWLSDLPGAGDFAACVHDWNGLMVDRLSVASDELQVDGMAFHCCSNGFGVGLAQPPVEAA